jgi:hypothetical protein
MHHLTRPRRAVLVAVIALVALLAPTLAAAHARHAPKPRRLTGNPARAQAAYQAMQQNFYLPATGLCKGQPYSYLWPFSQALAATISIVNVPALRHQYAPDLRVRLSGLQDYWDASAMVQAGGTSTLNPARLRRRGDAPARAGRHSLLRR